MEAKRASWIPGCLAVALAAAFTLPAAAQPAAQGDAPLSGSVREAVTAGEYTFLRLDIDGGEVWAAVPRFEATEGDRVDIFDSILVVDFFSNQLQRRFERIYLGSSVRVDPAGVD